MVQYNIGGQILALPVFLEELKQYKIHRHEVNLEQVDLLANDFADLAPASDMYAEIYGWVGGEDRRIEVWSSLPGTLLRVTGGSDFYISPDGHTVARYDAYGSKEDGGDLSILDREILLGLASVLVLAICETWSFHSSAVMCKGNTIAFLAESGIGKSTLAAYLSMQANWQLVADDILPVRGAQTGLTALPHFPQLKLPFDAQPGPNLPEQLPLNMLCELVSVDADSIPELRRLTPEQAVMVLLGHTAGSRLFDAKMLESHLAFCAQAAAIVPVYQLKYPHSKDALPVVKELLEGLC